MPNTSSASTLVFRLILSMVFVGILCVFIFFPNSSAATSENDTGETEKQQIRITADRLDTDTQSQFAEFVGKVRVAQGTFVMHSDRLRIYYKERGARASENTEMGNDIDRIIAEGNVKIQSEGRTATSERAEYTVDDMILVLTGEKCRILGGDNSITGKKIVFYRKDGRIKVESGGTDRVEALFYAGKGPDSQADRNQPIVVTVESEEPETAGPDDAMVALAPSGEMEKEENVPEPVAEETSPPDGSAPPPEGDRETVLSTPEPVEADASRIQSPPPSAIVEENIDEDRVPVEAEESRDGVGSSKIAAAVKEPPPAAETNSNIESALPSAPMESEPAPAVTVAATPSSETDMPAPVDSVHTLPRPETPPPVSLGELQTFVGMTVFSNETNVVGTGLEAMLQQRITEGIITGCPDAFLFVPDAPDAPEFLRDVPRRPNGRIDNISLISAGRKEGMRMVVAGRLVDLRVENETRGVWWMKDAYPILHLVFDVAIFDCESGTKLMDESFAHRVEIDELDYEMMISRSGVVIDPILPLLKETVAVMSPGISQHVQDIVNAQGWRGFVTAVEGNRISVSPGGRSGVVDGNRFLVFQQRTIEGAEGHLFYLPGRKKGEIQISHTSPEFASGTLVVGRNVSVGDVLRPPK